MNTSIIFVTLNDGEYRDRWTSDLLPIGTSMERKGVRELTWDGQRSGARDGLVGPGTLVAVRPNRNTRSFDIMGVVVLKTLNRPREGGHPAEYKLVVDMAANPRRIEKLYEDRFTHNTVLRAFGFPIERGALPQGIYGM